MAYTASSNQEIFVYTLGIIAIALLAFISASIWRQETRIERAIYTINEFIAWRQIVPPGAGMPASATSPATSTAPIAAQPSTRPEMHPLERSVMSVTRDSDPAHARSTPPGEDPDPSAIHERPAAVKGDANPIPDSARTPDSAGDPLELLRAVESELSALGALAEAAQPGEAIEYLDVPGALGPTLSLAARRIGVAVDLLESRPRSGNGRGGTSGT
jgi:hypothetical protein